MKRRIMIIDDEPAILQSLRRMFRITPCAYGILVYELDIELFESPLAALARARLCEFDAFLSDYRMAEMDGVTFLTAIREIQPDAVQILLSGTGDRASVERAFQGPRIFRFVAKPWDDATLIGAVAEALTYRDIMQKRPQVHQERQVGDD